MRRAGAEDAWDEEHVPYQLGSAAPAEADEADRLATAAAVLWVPDPEQRRGWREYFVRRAAPRTGRPCGLVGRT